MHVLTDQFEAIKGWLSDHVLDVIAYVDTVEMFVRFIPVGTRRAIEVEGCELWTKDCRDRNGKIVGHRLTVHQPTQTVIQIFDCLHDLPHCWACLHRFDIAVDLITRTDADAAFLKEWLLCHVVLRWRPRGPMHDEEYGSYWVDQEHRKHHGKKHSARDLAVYACNIRPSKIAHQPCAHLELRFQNSAACKKEVVRVRGLIKLDPSKLFAKHLRVSFISARYVRDAMRKASKDDRDRYEGRETSVYTDRYRASAARREQSFLHRLGHDRATWLRDRYRHLRKSQSYPFTSVVRVPDHVVFAAAPISTSTHRPSFLNYSMISVTATHDSNGNSEPTISSV
jgi:hypothetical protein